MRKNLNLIKEIVVCLSGLEINSFKNTKEGFAEFVNSSNLPAIPGMKIDIKSLHLLRRIKPDSIYEFRTPFEIYYFAFVSLAQKTVYVIGPTLTESFNKKNTEKQIKEYNLGFEEREKILKFCSGLPIVSYATLHDLSAILAKELCGTARFMSYETVEYLPDKSNSVMEIMSPPSELYKIRQIEAQYEMNNALIEAVKEGNTSLALRLMSQYSHRADLQERNQNPLRNMQNYCIILNTQLRRALEENKIHPFVLDTVSSQIGIQIERLKSTEEAKDFMVRSVRRYCALANENKNLKLTPLVHLAAAFIKEHLSEDITVKKTAEQLSVNANYLSTVFKKEMGISFIDYVNQERINQADSLLVKTNLQIAQIATTVGYNNTSYFAKQFIRFKGETPTARRKRG